MDSDSIYQYCYEYDIQQFYPSIQQRYLIKQLLDCLNIKENSGNESDKKVANLIKEIINYYNSENISEETKDVFDEYKKIEITKNDDLDKILYRKNNKQNQYNEEKKQIINLDKLKKDLQEDLGIPQGPLYSAFLAAFYSRDLLKNIKKKIKKIYNLDCEIFSYVDDGRIYLKDKVNSNGIFDLVDYEVNKLNDAGINAKIICINEDKSYLTAIDENSVNNKINYLMTESSVVNNSISPEFEIDDDMIQSIKNRQKNIKFEIKNLYTLTDKANLVLENNVDSRKPELHSEKEIP